MSTYKRLFLFAGYDKDCIVDDALIYHVSELSKFGDVILCMDCDLSEPEKIKLKPYTVDIIATRHGEYDFGSYKRCFEYAKNNNLLEKYDFVYMVNDSVFGPLFDMKKTIKNIEEIKSDACGMIVAKHKTHSYMESWFIRLNKKVFLSKWFDEFLSNVTAEPNKYIITIKYEHGLSNLIRNHNCSTSGLYEYRGRHTYNHPKDLFKSGCPFIKKASFARHNGDCGKQIKFIFKHANQNAVDAIMTTANRTFGEKYMKWFLTSNPLKIFIRKIRYLKYKIKSGQI